MDNKILIDITYYQMAENNLADYGFNSNYDMIKIPLPPADDITGSIELKNEDLPSKFNEPFYFGLSNEKLEKWVMEKSSYYHASQY